MMVGVGTNPGLKDVSLQPMLVIYCMPVAGQLLSGQVRIYFNSHRAS